MRPTSHTIKGRLALIRDEDDISTKLSALSEARSDEEDAASRVGSLEEECRDAGVTEEELSR